MVIKKLGDAPLTDLQGYNHVKKQIIIGPDDGSQEIVLRYFSIGTDGNSPYHTHDFPHLVKIEAGKGILKDSTGNEHRLQQGDYVYINNNEEHQLLNTGSEPFNFICIVPRRGEM
jgi:quercetin dioxygenase-like cupin family protein